MNAFGNTAPARRSPAQLAPAGVQSGPGTWLRLAALALFAAVLFACPGCAVTLLSSYDEVTDRGATELIAQTETFLARYASVTDATGRTIRKGKAYDADAATFYAEARGGAAALLIRSQEKAHNEDEISVITNLDRRYLRLEDSHRLGPITTTSASGLRRSLRALIHIQLTKKHIGTVKPSSGEAANS